jgi:ribosomal protein S18 acetylase RimI-like enzyme
VDSDKTSSGSQSVPGFAYATPVRAGLELRELDAGEFLANLDACTSVYAAAMDPPEYQLPGRHAIMERHAGYSAFRAIAVTQATAISAAGGSNAGSSTAASGRLADGPVIAFAYGFHGEGGQWWHDLVSLAVANTLGRRAADDWLGDSFEIAEVHVLPAYQGQGTGLAMMRRLAAGRLERTAVLSTMDADTPARRLYRGLGFSDLLAGFAFAGTEAPYAIMGAPLPLREDSPRPPRPDRPSRW